MPFIKNVQHFCSHIFWCFFRYLTTTHRVCIRVKTQMLKMKGGTGRSRLVKAFGGPWNIPSIRRKTKMHDISKWIDWFTASKGTVITHHQMIAVNTLRPRQNGRHFPDDIFKRIFLNENVLISIKTSLKFVPKGQSNNIPALVWILAWRRPGDKPLSEPMMVRLPTHRPICVTRPQWVKGIMPYHYATAFPGMLMLWNLIASQGIFDSCLDQINYLTFVMEIKICITVGNLPFHTALSLLTSYKFTWANMRSIFSLGIFGALPNKYRFFGGKNYPQQHCDTG